jgi:hypothetical protein
MGTTTTTINEGKEISGLSLRRVRMRAGRRDPSRGRYRVDGEIDVTATPEFLSNVLDTGVVIEVEDSTGHIVETTFEPADCLEERGGVRCINRLTRSMIRFRPPFAPKFHNVTMLARRQTFVQPSANDTPIMVHVNSGVDVVERMDTIDSCISVYGGRVLRCAEVPSAQ